jgi:DNA (cytosine-5)-methyltransferase 1
MTIGSLCTGYGGLDKAVRAVFGGELIWWSDIEDGPITIIKHRTNAPNLGDLKTVDWASVQRPRIFTAGYPCQPFSNAGLRLGTDDPRHLWPWIANAIGILRPEIIVLENVAAHLRRGFDIVSADLASLGYVVGWTIVRASDIGAPHQRRRLFIVAIANTACELFDRTGRLRQRWRSEHSDGREPATDTQSQRRDERGAEYAGQQGGLDAASDRGAIWGEYAAAIERWESVLGRVAPEPTEISTRGGRVLSPAFVEWMMGLNLGHVTDPMHGLTRNQQLKLLGNGVVPQQAEHAIRILISAMFQRMVTS